MGLFSKKSEEQVTLPEIIGLPPSAAGSDHLNFDCESNDIEYDGMPIVDIMAMEPTAQWASSFFTFRSAMSKNESESSEDIANEEADEVTPCYNQMLLNYGYKLAGKNPQYIRCAFLGDAQITETLTNNYEESFLEDLTSGFSKVSQVAQLVGGSSIGSLYRNVSDAINNASNANGGSAPDGSGVVQGAISDADQIGSVFKSLASQDSHLGSLAASTSKMIGMTAKKMAGARADFPKLWSGSNYEPTHSFTIRLYNPWPGSERATRYFINGPITALMLLATPRTSDGILYNWPFLVRARASGLFTIPIGYISNITVVRGGDNNQIALNQMCQIVDVKLEISSLYSSMVAFHNPRSQKAIQMKATSFRPMLDGFVRTFDNQKVLTNAAFYGHPSDWREFWNSPAGQMIINKVYYDSGIASVVKGVKTAGKAIENAIDDVKYAAKHPFSTAATAGIEMFHAIGDIGKGACGLIDDYVIDPVVQNGQAIANQMTNGTIDADISKYYVSDEENRTIVEKNLAGAADNIIGVQGTDAEKSTKFSNEGKGGRVEPSRYLTADGKVKPGYSGQFEASYVKTFAKDGDVLAAALRHGLTLAEQRQVVDNWNRNRVNGKMDSSKLLNDKNATNAANNGKGRSIKASYYDSSGSSTGYTATHQKYDPNDVSVATLQYPPGTRFQIYCPSTGKTITAVANDTGPFYPGREMDLSLGAARALGTQAKGVASVNIKVLSYPFEANKQAKNGATTATSRPTSSTTRKA